jgi:type IV pilus assembly protein PilO
MRTTPAIVRRYGVAAVAASLAVVFSAAVYAGVLRPIRATLGAAEAQWRTERDLIDRYKTYQRAYLDATTVTERATSRRDLPKLVTTLAGLAKRRGLSIPAVNYQAERFESEEFQKVGLTFAIAGPYGDIRRFLDDLERSSPFLTIEAVTLTRSHKDGAQLEVQLKVAAYLRVG